MKKIAALLLFFLPVFLTAQEARVAVFSHTLQWKSESTFPNYLLVSNIRDSIFNDIRQDLKAKLNVSDVVFPKKADYIFINRFGGKPQNKFTLSEPSTGYTIDIHSFLGKKPRSLTALWTLNVTIRQEDQVVASNEASVEIENENPASYIEEARWISPQQFRELFRTLFREAVRIDSTLVGKVITGTLEDREKEVLSWFPNSDRCLMKCTGALKGGQNFVACLVKGSDTIAQFNYIEKLKTNQPVSLKPALAELFTGLTGLGMDYSVTENQNLLRTIFFFGGPNILIRMKWAQKVTSSTMGGESDVRPLEPLIGKIYMDTTSIGNFTYERMIQVLSTGAERQKISSLEDTIHSAAGSLGTAIIHRVSGTINDRKFSVEYNELFGISEIKIGDETYASMVFQNCNPNNPNSFNRMILSDNRRSIIPTPPNTGARSLGKESKQEWYPVFIRQNSTPDDVTTDLEILTFLFFGMGRM